MSDQIGHEENEERRLPVHVTIEAIEVLREGDIEGGTENGQENRDIGKEQFMKLKVTTGNLEEDVEVEKTHLIIASDFSGSMGGTPEKQVKDALKDILSQTLVLPNITTDIIIYNSDAKLLEFTNINYETVIDNLRASSMTNFYCVFMKLNELFQKEDAETSRIIVVFLTDGCDTCNNDIQARTTIWIGNLKELQKDITIHSVGFSASHNFDFLQKLSTAGKSEGMFRYCEPGDGQTVLLEKLQELFDFIVLGSHQVKVMVSLDSDNKVIDNGELKSTCELEGEVVKVGTDDQESYEITADTWIYMPDPIKLPVVTVQVNKQIKNKEILTFPCEVISVNRTVLDSSAEKALWNLRIASRNADILAAKIADIITKKGDAAKVRERLNKLQEKVKNTQIFGKGIDKELREDMIKFLKEITTKIDTMHSMLASYIRGETQSVAMLARTHDMRYQCKFSKSRRQRLMDKRVAKNMSQAKSAQDELCMLQVDKEEVEKLNQDAVGFYFCALSQNSVKDILLGSDKDDVVGFGLAVKRPEHVLDEPTAIRLWNISGTLVSRNAMLDALEYKIKIDGHLSAHGGFDFNDSPLGVTTVGLAREPINAWLPLYVNQSHWDRVKILLKPTLGYFCTLDPLGYDYKQMDAMFMVLGNMIGQLSEKSIGEHQLKLLFAFHRTCFACVKDFDLTNQICDFIQNFIKSPAGRTKDVIPNLTVLIGYIVSLPANKIQAIFNKDGESPDVTLATTKRFWLAYLAELLRRAADSIYREASVNVINGLIDAIVHGCIKDLGNKCITTKEANQRLVQQCHSSDARKCTVDIPNFDPAAGLTIQDDGETKLDPKLDKTMEIWAKAEFNSLQGKNKANLAKNARMEVKNWMKKLKESVMADPKRKTNNPGDSLNETVNNKSEYSGKSEDDYSQSEDDFSQSDDLDREGKEYCIQSDSLSDKSNQSDYQADESDQSQITLASYDARLITESLLDVLTMLNTKLCNTAFPNLRTIPGCIAFINFWLTCDEDFQTMDENSGLPCQEWIDAMKQAVTSVYSIISDCSTCTEQQANKDPNVLVVMATDEEVQINATGTSSDDAVVSQSISNDNSQEVSTGTTDLNYCKGNHGNSNHENTNADGYDVMDDDLDPFDDYDDEIDYTDTASRETNKKKNITQRKITIPTILQIIGNDLDLIQMMRLMICQAVQYHSNSQARNAIKEQQFTDLSDTENINCEELLLKLHNYLQTYRENALQNIIDSAVWKKANTYMLQTPSIWSFIGYLMNTYTERHEGFSDLLSVICHLDSAESVPDLREKVHILLCGKYKDQPVIAKGNVWLPDNKISKKFSKLLGEEDWMSIEVDLRSNLQLHVYRASDLPNRHGHCNSNPYIPNVLREKLGMPLLKVKNKPRSRRLRSKFT